MSDLASRKEPTGPCRGRDIGDPLGIHRGPRGNWAGWVLGGLWPPRPQKMPICSGGSPADRPCLTPARAELGAVASAPCGPREHPWACPGVAQVLEEIRIPVAVST